MKTIILFLIFTFLHYISQGQETAAPIITIRSTTPVSGEAFSVIIFRNRDNIKVVYKIKESVSDKIEADSNLAKYRETLLLGNNTALQDDTVAYYLEQIDSIRQMYTTYRVDSLQFTKTEQKDFDNLLNIILSSTTEQLENKVANKSRVILDGTIISFKLTGNTTPKIVYAYSPNAISYPLLHQLLMQTIYLYKQIKSNDFLNARITSGY